MSVELKYEGELPKLKVKKSSSEVIEDALKWGKWIAGNNIFHYGEYGSSQYKTGKYKKIYGVTHTSGCPFCDTDYKKVKKANKLGFDGKNWEYTYVCNPFVTAMYAHGGQDITSMNRCKKGYSLGMTSKGRCTQLDQSDNWTYKGKLSIKNLKAGDVLVSPGHMQCVYAPVSDKEAKIIEATSYTGKYKSDASDRSIRISTKKPYYSSVYRFTGKVNRKIPIQYGEYSKRVKLWQKFLVWAGYEVKEIDGKFGDDTVKATCSFQSKNGLTVDGIVGETTLAKAAITVQIVEIEEKKYDGLLPTKTLRKSLLKKIKANKQVKLLQQFLNWYGNYKLVVDGKFGAKTEKAVKKFQKKEGLVVDGIFGPKSLEKAKTYL